METTNIKFNGGIWSEVLKGRYDLGNYQSASRTCENFIPTRYGQVEKRSGTKHIGYAKYDDKVCVLHAFQYSVTTKFILEFGEYYVRFWSNDLQVAHQTPAAWVSGNPYVAGDVVESGGVVKVVLRSTTSTNFNNSNIFYTLSDGVLEFPTPYLESELYEIQMRAVNDVIYITHPNHPVGKLTRFADDNWVYVVADLTLPFVDPDVNPVDVTLTASDVTGTINIEASSALFDSSYVGSQLRLRHNDEGLIQSFGSTGYPPTVPAFSPTTIYFSGDDVHEPSGGAVRRYMFDVVQDYDPSTTWVGGTYAVNDLVTHAGSVYICTDPHTSNDDPTINTGDWDLVTKPQNAPFYFDDGITRRTFTISEDWSFRTRGLWNGIWSLQRSIDGGSTFVTIKTLSSNDDQNYLIEESEGGQEVKIRLKQVAIPDNTTNPMSAEFTVLPGARYGVAEITAIVDELNATATVKKKIHVAGTPTVLWQESAFSPRQGYPRSIAFFDNRLVFAGTSKKPQAFFYSGINDYENFLGSTLADSPFFVEALSEDQSSVQWISAQRELFVGTASVEGILLTRKQEEAQSAENLPIVRWNESMGSAHRAALPMRDSLMCLQRGRTTINMLAYSLERDGYTGEEVSLLCPHLFESGVQQMAHTREPYTGAFTINSDGTMCHLIYEPKLQVTAWCKFTTKNGGFESVQVLPSTGDEDDVWCSVKRTINGVTCRHIERFTTSNRSKQRAGDIDNVWYVDAGIKVTGSGLTYVTGLDHLEGETICVLADGIKGEYTVSGGAITLSTPADTVIAGIPVTSEFEPLDIDYMPGNRSEGTLGKRKQTYQSRLMLFNSLGGSIASDGEDYQDLIYHVAGETMDESIPLKNGYAEVFHESSHSRQKWWRIMHDEPYPFTLQAVLQSFTVSKK